MAEADESPKDFIKRKMIGTPPEPFHNKKFRWKREYDPRTGRTSDYERRNVPGIRSTQFRRYDQIAPYPDKGYGVMYHDTEVLRWDKDQNVSTDTGGHYTKTTFRRMGDYAPHGWNFRKYHGTFYWNNNQWPEALRHELDSIVRRRRGPAHPMFIPYSRGDWIDKKGTLHKLDSSGKTYTKDGQIVEPQQWGVQEGKYQRELDWIHRVKQKHAKMKEVKHLEKELEDIDKPDKRKKKMNLR